MREFHGEKIFKSDGDVWGGGKTRPLFTMRIVY